MHSECQSRCDTEHARGRERTNPGIVGTPVACDHNVALQRARFRHSFELSDLELGQRVSKDLLDLTSEGPLAQI
jgi:hypothetical protein